MPLSALLKNRYYTYCLLNKIKKRVINSRKLNRRTDITMDKRIWKKDLYRHCLLSNQFVYYLNSKIFGNELKQWTTEIGPKKKQRMWLTNKT